MTSTMSVTLPTVELLPVLQDEPPLRADAARNRDKVLAAAEKLFAELSADCVSMDAVGRVGAGGNGGGGGHLEVAPRL